MRVAKGEHKLISQRLVGESKQRALVALPLAPFVALSHLSVFTLPSVNAVAQRRRRAYTIVRGIRDGDRARHRSIVFASYRQ